MKTRSEVAAFIKAQFVNYRKNNGFDNDTLTSLKKGGKHHYGKQDLRELMDFIYGGAPAEKSEAIES